jgi:hypothetical protein
VNMTGNVNKGMKEFGHYAEKIMVCRIFY